MWDKSYLDKLKKDRETWEKNVRLDKAPGAGKTFKTDTKFDIQPVYSPLDLHAIGMNSG